MDTTVKTITQTSSESPSKWYTDQMKASVAEQLYGGRDRLRWDERFWYAHRDWLKTQGYGLRARYQEGWIPSWKGTTKFPVLQEDGVLHRNWSVMDATRLEDGVFVMMKKINQKVHPFEVDIATWFSEEPQRSDPENHCVPIFDVLQSPYDTKFRIIVMPLLQPYSSPMTHLDSTRSAKPSRSSGKSSRDSNICTSTMLHTETA